jgi:putative ABC transport system substrate-binding protein
MSKTPVNPLVIALAIVAAPSLAGAQPAQGVPRIGYLGTNIGPASMPPIEAFKEGLRDAGWTEGQNIVVEWRWGRGTNDEAAATGAAELAGLKLDLLVAASSTYVPPLLKVRGERPIVFCAHGDPVGAGHAASLERPGGNMSGIWSSSPDLDAKNLEVLRETLPGARRVGVLWDPNSPANEPALRILSDSAGALGIEIHPVSVKSAAEFEGAYAGMKQAGAEAMVGIGSSLFFNNRPRLAALELEHRLPAIWSSPESAAAGSLLGRGTDVLGIFRRCASYVDRILKGAKAGELPIEPPAAFKFAINMKTARALALTIPPHVIARADTVIE